jgi:ribose transport system ATP-binding protein
MNAYPWSNRPQGPVLLEVKDLVAPGVRSTSLAARSGQIVGLVGLDGAGRTELLKAIEGAARPSSGSVHVESKPVRLGSVVNARKLGIVYAPENRKAEGLILDASIRDNVVLGLYSLITRAGLVLSGRLAALAKAAVREYGIKAESIRQTIGTLSGGNQQKVILARVARGGSRVIMLDDPTRGVDVGAKFSQTVRKLRMSGFLVGEIDVRIVYGSHFGIRARPASVVAGGGRRLRGRRESGPFY